MKTFASSLLLLGCSLTATQLQAAPPAESAKIDSILEKSWQKLKVTPGQRSSDEVFLRRVYLDVIGRIPSYDEAKKFLEDKTADKREKLIDQLLASDGYSEHFFNYWADVLRVQTAGIGGGLSGPVYTEFVRDSLKSNRHYDDMVRELVASRGTILKNKAAGYYMRDRGMPLDNMANTVRIFLGTRVECAQCHNHPFDKWKQMDFYKMAAFTYGVDAANGKRGEAYTEIMKSVYKDKDNPVDKDTRKFIGNAMTEIFRPLDNSMVQYNEKKVLQLPHDYQYPDAKPKDAVQPAVIFGKLPEAKPGDTNLDLYARWISSPETPRFTTVVANRLWKKVFGVGVIEPVDDLNDATVPMNPELMSYLETVMVSAHFDMKTYLRTLLNTKAYQNAAPTREYAPGEAWTFTGPMVRRMTAEQAWDSLVTLIALNPDAPNRVARRTDADREEKINKIAEILNSKSKEELLGTAQEVAAMLKNQAEDYKRIQKELADAKVEAKKSANTAQAGEIQEKLKAAQKQQGEMRRAMRKIISEKIYNGMPDTEYNSQPASMPKPEEMLVSDEQAKLAHEMDMLGIDKPNGVPAKDPEKAQAAINQRILSFKRARASTNSSWVRAAELTSPAPAGHFLREFGQSDRVTIENSNDGASVPQVLNLLNGKVIPQVLDVWSTLKITLASLTGDSDKVKAVYLMLMSRQPNEKEEKIALEVMQKNPKTGVDDLVTALLNTQQFLFVR